MALNLSTKEKGFYRMVMQVRSASNKLAQMPVAIYNGMQYVETITVNGTEGQSITTTIKAIAVKNGMQDSSVETFTYTIKIPVAKYTATVIKTTKTTAPAIYMPKNMNLKSSRMISFMSLVIFL